MSLASFFTKNGNKNKFKKCALLVDIGSASVTVALVLLENTVSNIIATATTDIAILSDLTYDRFEKEMQKALVASLGKILKNTTVPLDRINVCLASPWYASQVRTAKLVRLASFPVSKSILDDMIKRELKSFQEEEVKSKNLAGDAVRGIESQTIRARLNGYETHQPIGLTAKELELTIFLSVASESTLKNIEEIISRVYAAPIMFSSFLSMTYLVARDFFPTQENYILLDVGGEVTDISLVKENGLQQSFSFPLGKNFILRRLSEGLKRSIAESETLWALHLEGKTDGAVRDACSRILLLARNEWQTEFQKALYVASKDLSIPDLILLTVDDDVAVWFSDTIKDEQFHQSTLVGKEFKILFMNGSLFNSSLSFGAKASRDASIMIETIGMRYLFAANIGAE